MALWDGQLISPTITKRQHLASWFGEVQATTTGNVNSWPSFGIKLFWDGGNYCISFVAQPASSHWITKLPGLFFCRGHRKTFCSATFWCFLAQGDLVSRLPQEVAYSGMLNTGRFRATMYIFCIKCQKATSLNLSTSISFSHLSPPSMETSADATETEGKIYNFKPSSHLWSLLSESTNPMIPRCFMTSSNIFCLHCFAFETHRDRNYTECVSTNVSQGSSEA